MHIPKNRINISLRFLQETYGQDSRPGKKVAAMVSLILRAEDAAKNDRASPPRHNLASRLIRMNLLGR